MAAYTSEVITVDTLNPVINVAYANTNKINAVTDAEGHVRNYYNSVQTATVSVNEHNFDQNEVDLQITAKDIRNELAIDSLCTRSDGVPKGYAHNDSTYAGSANYTFDVSYTDQAANPAADYAADYFTVDTNKTKKIWRFLTAPVFLGQFCRELPLDFTMQRQQLRSQQQMILPVYTVLNTVI